MDARLEGVSFAYGERTVLEVPELTFAPRRVTALVGPNGSGKSTLLRLLAALERPQQGRVRVGGEDADAARASVAYAFQEAVFVSGSLRGNLELALRLRGLAAAERESRLEESAAACGVEHLLDRRANRLSGGEAQRANLARTLALRAPLTLLDEPLAGFDEPGRRVLLRELPELLRRFATTTIIVTHDRDEALRLADDLVVLREGRVAASGPKARVFTEPPDPDTAAFLGYTLLPTDLGPVGVAPGALRPGRGDFTVELCIEEVVDLVTTVELAGTVAGEPVAFTVERGDYAPGGRVTLGAPADAIVQFSARPRE